MQFDDEFWKLIAAAHGWCWRQKAEYIYRLGLQSTVRTAVEIGVFGGRSFVPLAAAMIPRGGKCIGYDIYKPHRMPTEADQKHWDPLPYTDIYRGAQELLKKAGLPPDLVQIASSSDAARCYQDETLNYVHVDGSHRPWDAVEDIILWSRRLASGGYLLIDDTNWEQLKPACELMKFSDFDHLETLTDPDASGETQIWRKR